VRSKKELLHILLQQPTEGALQEDLKAEVLNPFDKRIANAKEAVGRFFQMAYWKVCPMGDCRGLQINNQSVRNHKQRAIKLFTHGSAK